ncbi:MAG: hypothetical protein ACQJCO_03090 [cyanobacterium endosymbiont of Rhopalodia sterrenbergii]
MNKVVNVEIGLDRMDKKGLVVIFPESITQATSSVESCEPIADEYL